MTDYNKISELYYRLDTLTFMHRDISNAHENIQTKDHLFELEIAPRVNSRKLSASKVKYRNQLLAIVDGEIEETKQNIAKLSSEK